MNAVIIRFGEAPQPQAHTMGDLHFPLLKRSLLYDIVALAIG